MHDFYPQKLLALGDELKKELEDIVAMSESEPKSEPEDRLYAAFQRMGYNQAEELVDCALSFSSAPIMVQVWDSGAGHASPRDFLKLLASTPQAQMGMSIALANTALTRTPDAVKRAEDLIALILAIPLSPHAASYVSRSTELYVWGFDVECVVLCRSALEAALSEYLTDDLPDDTYSLNDLIAAARDRRQMPQTLVRSARALQRAGNAAVHGTPSFADRDVPDALTALKHLSAVLGHVFPVPPRPGSDTA